MPDIKVLLVVCIGMWPIFSPCQTIKSSQCRFLICQTDLPHWGFLAEVITFNYLLWQSVTCFGPERHSLYALSFVVTCIEQLNAQTISANKRQIHQSTVLFLQLVPSAWLMMIICGSHLYALSLLPTWESDAGLRQCYVGRAREERGWRQGNGHALRQSWQFSLFVASVRYFTVCAASLVTPLQGAVSVRLFSCTYSTGQDQNSPDLDPEISPGFVLGLLTSGFCIALVQVYSWFILGFNAV